MLKAPSCTLVISTYNWPEALDLCLTSLKGQSVFPDEVIIGDDGSREETRLLIEKYQKDFPVPIIHKWQPDEGFRVAKIRNQAFAAASGEYIIQIDGDLILHPHFIKDHLNFAEKGHFVTGSRILLTKEFSATVIDKKQIRFPLFTSGMLNIANGLRFKALSHLLAKNYKMRGDKRFYVKGCNMAFWRKDLITVNGYDENFEGWGKEDSDLAIHLVNAGVVKKFLKLGGVVYHMYHKESSRVNELLNTQRMNESIRNKVAWIEKGINQYL